MIAIKDHVLILGTADRESRGASGRCGRVQTRRQRAAMVTVASYNLNQLSFFDKCQEGQLDQLRDLVVSEASKGVGLFCFQLASEAVLAEIQCTLTGAQFPHRIFASHDAFDAFGLGVISRYPLGSVRTHAIPVEQGKEDKVFALTFDLKVPGERPIRFTNLWLNNSSEDARFP